MQDRSSGPRSRKLVKTTTPGIFQRGGRYVVVFRDAAGKQCKRSARTLAEARALKASLTTDVARGEYRASSTVRFRDHWKPWIESYAGRTSRGFRETTREEYKRDLTEAEGFFGRMRLAEIEAVEDHDHDQDGTATVTLSEPEPITTVRPPEVSVAAGTSVGDEPSIEPGVEPDVVFALDDLDVYYGSFRAVRGVSLEVRENEITAFIGPSGCGKTTVLRCLNRMNDLIEGCRITGTVNYDGIDLYDPKIDAVEVRKRIGMVFQKPNPFPKSIYDNVAFGPRLNGIRNRSELDGIVEQALRGAALWDEVKDRLKASAMGMSGGQQQRLCIARTIAVKPDVVLMDEPCSALDPIATARVEDLMQELKADFTIVIVTHNMQQAARVSDRTAFFTAEVNPAGDLRTGVLVEYDGTQKIFSNPGDERTENYVTGRFG